MVVTYLPRKASQFSQKDKMRVLDVPTTCARPITTTRVRAEVRDGYKTARRSARARKTHRTYERTMRDDARPQLFLGHPLDSLAALCNMAPAQNSLSNYSQTQNKEEERTKREDSPHTAPRPAPNAALRSPSPDERPTTADVPTRNRFALVGAHGPLQRAREVLVHFISNDDDLQGEFWYTSGTLDETLRVYNLLKRECPNGPVDLEASYADVEDGPDIVRIPLRALRMSRALSIQKGQDVSDKIIDIDWKKTRTGNFDVKLAQDLFRRHSNSHRDGNCESEWREFALLLMGTCASLLTAHADDEMEVNALADLREQFIHYATCGDSLNRVEDDPRAFAEKADEFLQRFARRLSGPGLEALVQYWASVDAPASSHDDESEYGTHQNYPMPRPLIPLTSDPAQLEYPEELPASQGDDARREEETGENTNETPDKEEQELSIRSNDEDIKIIRDEHGVILERRFRIRMEGGRVYWEIEETEEGRARRDDRTARLIFGDLSDTESDSAKDEDNEDIDEIYDDSRSDKMDEDQPPADYQAPVAQNRYAQRFLPSSFAALTAGGGHSAGDLSPSHSTLYNDLASSIPSGDSFTVPSNDASTATTIPALETIPEDDHPASVLGKRKAHDNDNSDDDSEDQEEFRRGPGVVSREELGELVRQAQEEGIWVPARTHTSASSRPYKRAALSQFTATPVLGGVQQHERVVPMRRPPTPFPFTRYCPNPGLVPVVGYTSYIDDTSSSSAESTETTSTDTFMEYRGRLTQEEARNALPAGQAIVTGTTVPTPLQALAMRNGKPHCLSDNDQTNQNGHEDISGLANDPTFTSLCAIDHIRKYLRGPMPPGARTRVDFQRNRLEYDEFAQLSDLLGTIAASYRRYDLAIRANTTRFPYNAPGRWKRVTVNSTLTGHLEDEAAVLHSLQNHPLATEGITLIQLRSHLVTALLSVFDRAATNGFFDTVADIFRDFKQAILDLAPASAHTDARDEALGHLQLLLRGFRESAHPLLHDEEALFIAQVQLFLDKPHISLTEWTAVRALVDAIVKTQYYFKFSETALAVFRSGKLGGPWQYPPPGGEDLFMQE